MGARDYWDRMLVYFGIAEEAYDDEGEDWVEEQPATRSSRRSARASARSVDEYEEPAPAPRRAPP
ncbi:MAG: hypothetical protein JWM86_661, partial [Thermoleophilia bacterium]|nr:hypothetical protein [Thermoleophilia bacterium]